MPYIPISKEIQKLIWLLYVSVLVGKRVSKPVLSKLLKKLGWRWNIPTIFQHQKYSFQNLTRYLHYMETIQVAPWHRIKFLDECQVSSRKLSIF